MLKFQSKDIAYNSKQQLTCTLVWLGNDDGARYPVYLPKEDIEKPNAELYEIAMEIIYQENFPQRAENEKFNTLGEKIAEYDKLIEKATLTIDKMETQMTKQQEQSSMAQVTLMSVIFNLYEKGILTDEDLAETTISEVE